MTKHYTAASKNTRYASASINSSNLLGPTLISHPYHEHLSSAYSGCPKSQYWPRGIFISAADLTDSTTPKISSLVKFSTNFRQLRFNKKVLKEQAKLMEISLRAKDEGFSVDSEDL